MQSDRVVKRARSVFIPRSNVLRCVDPVMSDMTMLSFSAQTLGNVFQKERVAILTNGNPKTRRSPCKVEWVSDRPTFSDPGHTCEVEILRPRAVMSFVEKSLIHWCFLQFALIGRSHVIGSGHELTEAPGEGFDGNLSQPHFN